MAPDPDRIVRICTALEADPKYPKRSPELEREAVALIRELAQELVTVTEERDTAEREKATPLPAAMFLTVRLHVADHVLRADVLTGRGAFTCRRWPWPPQGQKNRRHLEDGGKYAAGLARVLGCPIVSAV